MYVCACMCTYVWFSLPWTHSHPRSITLFLTLPEFIVFIFGPYVALVLWLNQLCFSLVWPVSWGKMRGLIGLGLYIQWKLIRSTTPSMICKHALTC